MSIFLFFSEVITAQSMDNLEVQLKKQIQNELLRICNSMIKEIRRDIFERITRLLTSQGVYVYSHIYLHFSSFLDETLDKIKLLTSTSSK